MEFQKVINLLDLLLMIKIYLGLLLKNRLKYMISQKKVTVLIKKLELKHQCLDPIYVILVMRILL